MYAFPPPKLVIKAVSMAVIKQIVHQKADIILWHSDKVHLNKIVIGWMHFWPILLLLGPEAVVKDGSTVHASC